VLPVPPAACRSHRHVTHSQAGPPPGRACEITEVMAYIQLTCCLRRGWTYHTAIQRSQTDLMKMNVGTSRILSSSISATSSALVAAGRGRDKRGQRQMIAQLGNLIMHLCCCCCGGGGGGRFVKGW
jgi:hypothetical protein